MSHPNVLFINTDTQSHNTIAAGGFAYMHTPNLDRLAHEGALFTHAFCNSPVCMPSRQSFFSGQYPSALNLTANGQELPEDTPLFHHVLKQYGYETACIGKLHFRNVKPREFGEVQPDYGFDRMILAETIAPGFRDAYSVWLDENFPGMEEQCRSISESQLPQFRDGDYRPFLPLLFQGPEGATHTSFVAEETCRFIRESSGGKPWFANAGIFHPHDPFNPPERFLQYYEPDELPPPQMTEADRERCGLSDDDWRIICAHYFALCSHIDEQVGRMLDCLDETGQADNTIVVFFSDHGGHQGNHGKAGKTAPGYDTCSRVPLLMRYPARIQPDKRCDDLVELVDLAPTILDLCSAEVPPHLQGRSLAPWLLGRSATAGRESAFMEIGNPGAKQFKAVRTKDYYFAVNNNGGEELYDMQEDPNQLCNQADNPEYKDMLLEGYRCLTQRIFQARPHVPRFQSNW